MATWDIRSRKRQLGLSLSASFSLSGGTQPSIEEGNRSRSQEKTPVNGQQTIREGMQRLHERPVTDFFRHDATSWMELVHRLDARTRGPPSGSPLISMVQPTHDRKSDHLVVCILSGRIRSALFWNLLSNPLMRPCPVEGGHIGIEHAARVASHAGSTGGPGILAQHSSKSVRRWRWGVSHEPAF